MSYVLLISLGPIQEFIASARRCQDLWFGSWLLSELARVTALRLARDCGEDALVFPGSLDVGPDEGQKPAVANKILAVVDRGDVGAVAREAEAAMRACLAELSEVALGRLPSDAYFSDELRERARRQLRDLMEFNWVAVPFAGDRRDAAAYADARDRAERLLAARKNRRDWGQVALAREGGWGDHVPKSSLDGLRESVLHERLYDAVSARRAPGRGGLRAQDLRARYFVRNQERLCGVGIVKRVGSEVDDLDAPEAPRAARRPVFHSTSHVATAPLRTRVAALGDAARAAVDDYAASALALFSRAGRRGLTLPRLAGAAAQVRHPFDGAVIATPAAFGRDHFDGRLLHRGQFPALVEDHLGVEEAARVDRDGDLERSAVERLNTMLSALLSKLGLSADGVPTYYATVLADGDGMGAALDAVGRAAGLTGHRIVSTALDRFSQSCRAIVEEHAGSLVYAGGDDVLALVPMHTALACVRQLHDAFGDAMRTALRNAGVEVSPPTLSVGVGVGHHLDDMADVRRLAKRAEEVAKSVAGKDALAVIVQMRSGGELEVSGRFCDDDPIDRRLAAWAQLQLSETIPGKAAHDLEAEMAVLLQGGGEPGDEVARSLARRVLDRKRGNRGEEPLSAKVRAMTDAAIRGPSTARAVRALSQELQVARLVAEAVRIAFPSAETSGGAS